MGTSYLSKHCCIGISFVRNFGAISLAPAAGSVKVRSNFKGNSRMESSSSFSKPYTVFVEGNIGSGKTTFLKHFESLGNVTTLAEPVERWRSVRGENLLGKMYTEPSRWGITLQSFVQLTMLGLHTQPVNRPIKMMERSIHSARYCFVENLHQSKVMPHPDFVVLDEWFQWILKNHDISGDLIIYLRTSPEVVHKRIMARARAEESCVPLEYLQQLHTLHENWLFHRTSFSCPAPVLVVDANQDLANMKEALFNCEARIRDALATSAHLHLSKLSPSKINVVTSPIKLASPS